MVHLPLLQLRCANTEKKFKKERKEKGKTNNKNNKTTKYTFLFKNCIKQILVNIGITRKIFLLSLTCNLENGYFPGLFMSGKLLKERVL